MKVGKLAELKKAIGDIVNNASEKKFPEEIIFNRGLEYTKFKITIEEIEEDFFVDSKGIKWVKVKEPD